MRNVKLMVTT